MYSRTYVCTLGAIFSSGQYKRYIIKTQYAIFSLESSAITVAAPSPEAHPTNNIQHIKLKVSRNNISEVRRAF
jgi:hypothetical protein